MISRDAESDTEQRTTTVVVVDDHVFVAELLCRALAEEPDLTCLGAAHSFAEGEALVTALRPDVVVLDARLGDGNGVELAARLTRDRPDLRVVILTAYGDADLAAAAAEAGVGWLMSKQGSLEGLLTSLRAAPREGLVVDPVLFLEISRPVGRAGVQPRLTRREHEVLQLLAEGLDTRGIAKKLDISVHTCRGYVKSLLGRLGAHSQLQAVAIARDHGLLQARPNGGGSGYPRDSGPRREQR